MDGMLQMKEMSDIELRFFAQEQAKEEYAVAEHMKRRDEILQMDMKLLRGQYGGRQEDGQRNEQKKANPEMPQQDMEEKESKRRKRDMTYFDRHLTGMKPWDKSIVGRGEDVPKRAENIRRENKLDEWGRYMFGVSLDENLFTPNALRENLFRALVKLGEWRRHIELLEQENLPDNLLARDKQLRLDSMKAQYEHGKQALRQGLLALGYEYRTDGGKEEIVPRKMSEKEKAQALLKNRALRAQIAENGEKAYDRVAETLIEEARLRIHEAQTPFRTETAQEEGYDPVQAERLSLEYRQAELARIRELIQQHPEEYAQNKELVDKLTGELHKLTEALGMFAELAMSRTALKGSVSIEKVRVRVQQQLEARAEEGKLVGERAEAVKSAIRHYLTGSGLTERESLSVAGLLPVQEEHREARQRAAMAARGYVDGYWEKKAGAAVPEDAAAAKSLVRQYLERVRAFDTKNLARCSDEELLKSSGELQELALTGMQLAGAGKLADPQDTQGRSILKVLLSEDSSLDLKCRVIQSYAVKARALSMIRAYRLGGLTEECFFREELDELHERMGLEKSETLSGPQLLLAARELLEKAAASYAAACSTYFTEETLQQKYAGTSKQLPAIPHPQHQERLGETQREGLRWLKSSEGTMRAQELKQFYRFCSRRTEELEEQLGRTADAGRQELTEELEKYRRWQKGAEQLYALRARSYKKAGETQSLTGETLFLSFDSVGQLPAFSSMSEEEFETMCAQLSAGALAEDAAVPERMEYYQEENRKGLLTYRQGISRHYEMLEETFQHRLPSLEYIEEHRMQLEQWFANVQADVRMVDRMRDLIDLTKPEDLRLYHLVHVYASIGSYILEMGGLLAHGSLGYKDADYASQAAMRGAAASFRHLDAAPEQETVARLRDERERLLKQGKRKDDQKEWLARMEAVESPLMAEDFRQLAEDAAGILRRKKPEQLAYQQRVRELTEYIGKYEEINSPHMQQFRGWLKVAQQRMPMLAGEPSVGVRRVKDKEAEARRYNSHADAESYDLLLARQKVRGQAGWDTFGGLAGRLGSLQVTEEMLTREYMAEHMEELLDSFETMDAYDAMLAAEPALEETLPAEQRIVWRRNRGIYERYRDYVMLYARTHGVDLEKGEYLTTEVYESEEKEMNRELSAEEGRLREILGDFGGYTDQISEMTGRVNKLKKLKKKEKAAVLAPLQEAGGWMSDLTRYLGQTIVISDESFFDATVMTLMSMLGYLEKSLRQTREAMGALPKEKSFGEMSARLQEFSDTFSRFKEQIPGYARDYRELLQLSDAGMEITLHEALLGAQGIRKFTIKDWEQNVGAGSSDVYKVKEGNKSYYFKEDEKLGNFYDEIQEILPMLENEKLEQAFWKILAAEKHCALQIKEKEEKGIPCPADLKKQYKDAKSDVSSVSWDVMQIREAVQKNRPVPQGNLTSLAETLGEDIAGYMADHMEKWLKFSAAFSKTTTTADNVYHRQLRLKEGDNMTARNYASERVAELFGLKDLIVRNSEAMIVSEDGKKKKGFVMEEARGKTIAELKRETGEGGAYPGYEIHVSGEAQKQLLNLQILDNITGQSDRHTGNYLLAYEADAEKKCLMVTKVMGIDNDFAFGMAEKLGGINTDSILNADDRYDVGMMDRELYERMQAVSPELLAVQLEGVIEPEYLEALKKRYVMVREKIREAAEEAEKSGEDFFRTKGGWGEETEDKIRGNRQLTRLFLYKILGKK